MNWLLQNPWMLLWAVAAILPLILYRLRKQTRQRVPWAAMSFLREAPRVSATRKRWRRWLLLSVRVLLPIIIALFSATPGCVQKPASQESATEDVSQPTHWIFVFDTSASMGPSLLKDGSTVSSLQKAKRLALQQVQQAQGKDVFSVLTAGDLSPANRFSEISSSDAVSSIAAIQTGFGSFDWNETRRRMARLPHSNPDYVHRLVVFSDFRLRDWMASNLNLAELEEQLPFTLFDVQLVDCRQPIKNASISELRCQTVSMIEGQTTECFVQLRGSPNQQAAVELLSNEQSLGTQPVSINNEGIGLATFPLRANSINDLRLEARLVNEAEGLLADNQRFLVLPVKDHIRVLCIEETSGLSARFAATLQQSDTELVPTKVTTRLASGLSNLSTDTSDIVALFGIDALDRSGVESLGQFVEQGGAVIVSPATNFAASKELLSALGIEILAETELSPGDFRFDPLQYRHPIVQPFKNHPNSGIIDVPVSRYHRVDIDNSLLNVILQYDSGDPALFSVSHGAGKVIFATTPFTHSLGSQENRWNQLSAWWSFVPLVNETVKWAFGSSSKLESQIVGERWQLHEEWFGFQSELRVASPAGRQSSLQPSDQLLITSPGIWTASSTKTYFFAANLSPDESDRQLADISELRTAFSLALQADGLAASADSTFKSELRSPLDSAATRRLLFALSIVILLLLIAESLLASELQGNMSASSDRGGATNG